MSKHPRYQACDAKKKESNRNIFRGIKEITNAFHLQLIRCARYALK